ncbi:MAG TPA: sortase [Candidatus Saccharibacteria bacterium]|nr:sortase [Candidatus Saccharibacteria bacterium]HMR38367.1 sortase [Candidatus Saccharibacteria bacterium]
MQPNNRPSVHPYTRSRAAGAVSTAQRHAVSQAAVADMTRGHIDQLYSQDPHHQMPVPQPAVTDNQGPTTSGSALPPPQSTPTPQPEQQAAAIYDKTLGDKQPQVDPDAWKKYHSSWQNYYQQYFYRYYAGHMQQAQQIVSEKDARLKEYEQKASEQTPEEALTDLRSKLRQTVQKKATEVRKSRHFRPIFAACMVMLVFAVLQYNSVALAAYHAYIEPAGSDPTNLIVDPTESIDVGPDPRLIIPKIGVDVPVVWNTKPDHDSQMKAMEKGVAWFGIPGANSKPGQVGNTVLSGHSSNDWTETGEHKFVFARLDRLTVGDTFFINYEGVRYAYTVTKKRIVMPDNVASLTYKTDKPEVTLITCTPLGTADKRLLVTAEQISPSPAEAKPSEVEPVETAEAEMPGKGQTVFEKIGSALGF